MTAFELYFCATFVRGAAVVLFLLAAESVLRHRLGAGFRRMLWLGCLVLMLVPQMNFSASPFRFDLSSFNASVPAIRETARSGGAGNGNLRRGALSGAGRTGFGFRALLRKFRFHRRNLEFALFVLLPLPALLLLLGRYLRCRRTIRTLPPVSDRRILEVWNRILAECGPLPRPVILLDSTQSDLGPTLFGCFTRKLLLPAGAFRGLSDDALELLLEHEYRHNRARDPGVNILALVLCALAWYNPFMFLARKRLRISCEMECDRRILVRHPDAVREYGNLLLRFVSPSSSAAFPSAIGLAQSPRELSRRIRGMTAAAVRPGSDSPAGRWCAVLLAVALAAPIGLIAIDVRGPSPRMRPAAAVPRKPWLPYLTVKALPVPAADPGLLQCWEIAYPDPFPRVRSELTLEIGETQLTVRLDRRPGFLLLRRQGSGLRLEPAFSLSLYSFLPGEKAAKVLSVRRLPVAADGKRVGASVRRLERAAFFRLQVDGIGPAELRNYRRRHMRRELPASL